MKNKQQLCRAITERKVVQFNYKGRLRIVEPFTLGKMKGSGNYALRAYQIGGFSESHAIPYWRLYLLSEIEMLDVTWDDAPTIRPGYNPNDSGMDCIDCAA